MTYPNMETFFKQHLHYKQHWNKRNISMNDAAWQSLTEDTWLAGCEYAKGSRFKVFETPNFGWIVFDQDARTPNGNIPDKRIIKW